MAVIYEQLNPADTDVSSEMKTKQNFFKRAFILY